MDNEELLQKIGLTEVESQLYLTLLQLGPSTAGQLSKKMKVQRSTVYYVLESLQEKGLVAFTFRGKIKSFRASNPHILEEYARETYTKIKELIPTLIISESKEKEEALLFIGYKGLKAAYEQMLMECKPDDEVMVLGARGGEDISSKTYGAFYKNFNQKRIQKKVNQRVIMNKDLKIKIGKYYETLKRTTVRYLNQKTYVPIVIFPTAVAIVQWKEEPTLFLLRGHLVVDSFRQYFNSLWKIAKSN